MRVSNRKLHLTHWKRADIRVAVSARSSFSSVPLGEVARCVREIESTNVPFRKAAEKKLLLRSLCARRRGTGKDLLNDLPTAVWMAFENDYVAAFGGYFSAGGDDR